MVLITVSMAYYKRIGFRVEKGNAVTYFCVFGTCMWPLKKKTIFVVFLLLPGKKKKCQNFSLCLHVTRSHNVIATWRMLVIQNRLNSENQKIFSCFFFLHGGSHFEIKQQIVTAKFVRNVYPDVIIYRTSKYYQFKYNYIPLSLHTV